MADAFSFFDLPLELRNIIYRELSRPVTPIPVPGQKINPPEFVWKASVKSYVIPALLNISKQFKHEYEREVCQKAKLCLRYAPWQALGTYLTGLRPILLPGCLLVNICHVEVDIVLRDWYATVRPMLEEKCELLRVCNLPNMQTLEIHFTILPDMPEHWLTEATELFDDISELFTLVRSFSTVCAQMYRRAKVDVGVYVKAKSFEPYTNHIYSNPLDQLNLVDFINQELDEIPTHETVWKASVAQPGDEYAFEGINLEFLRCGHFDAEEYDEFVEDAITILEYEMSKAGEKTSLID